MKKKAILSFMAVIAIALGVVGMAAFEAHVINVTAKIEHALSILPDNIKFGTVFPEEVLTEQLEINMSESFINEERVDSINYKIKQKPKPREEITTPFPGGVAGHEYCLENSPTDPGDPQDPYYEWCYPSLCEYLSKDDADPDDQNDDPGVPAMHDPGITILEALMSKQDNDSSDLWDISLLAPCFQGECAQDGVVPEQYQLDPRLKGEVLGCDLWFEVTGVNKDREIDPLEQACLDSGGTVATSNCCQAVSDFPDLCATGACGCDPGSSHEVRVCICAQGFCFNGQTCVSTCDPKPEVCNDNLDNDCDSLTDCDDPDCDQDPACAECTDIDGDGWFVVNGDGWFVGSICLPGIPELVQEDCDDSNPLINPMAEEICNDGIDNDCDMLVDCDDDWCLYEPVCAPPNSIVINEIMQNPDSPLNDSDAEWFEIYNNSDDYINLEGCIISDNNSNSHIISPLISTLIIPGHGYAVLARSGDFNLNGGIVPDYVYDNFTLTNGEDKIIITCDGLEMDRVEYDDGATFPDPTGMSMILADPSLDNNIGGNWCVSTSIYWAGNLGTPGVANDSCVLP